MEHYRIIKLTLDNSAVYIRRELVGKSTIGGDDSPPYQLSAIKRHFASMVQNKQPHEYTPLDAAAIAATTIDVEVLCELHGTKDHAKAVKAYEVGLARQSGLNVLNRRV